MKHFYGLMDFKKAFKQAQEYHVYAIQNGSQETKKAHLEHHHKGGNYDVLVQRTGKHNNPAKGSGR